MLDYYSCVWRFVREQSCHIFDTENKCSRTAPTSKMHPYKILDLHHQRSPLYHYAWLLGRYRKSDRYSKSFTCILQNAPTIFSFAKPLRTVGLLTGYLVSIHDLFFDADRGVSQETLFFLAFCRAVYLMQSISAFEFSTFLDLAVSMDVLIGF